jgi:hypothetical protein
MILQTTQLSPSQKAAIEEKAGRELTPRENIVFCCGTPKVASAAERETAVQRMRYQLALRDTSQRRLSIADSMALLLGETGTELTA